MDTSGKLKAYARTDYHLATEVLARPLFPQLTLCSDLAPLVGTASPGGAAAGAAAGFTADTEGKKHSSQKQKPGRKSPEVESTFELLA